LEDFMEKTTLSSKGQVIIPKRVREHHRWRPGTEFILEDRPEGILLRPSGVFPPTDLRSGLGCAGYAGPSKSLEEIRKGLDEDLKRRWRGGEE
jgi:AbrB family looped-hinge helix DNA binding protein